MTPGLPSVLASGRYSRWARSVDGWAGIGHVCPMSRAPYLVASGPLRKPPNSPGLPKSDAREVLVPWIEEPAGRMSPPRARLHWAVVIEDRQIKGGACATYLCTGRGPLPFSWERLLPSNEIRV